jgi:signal transduction histidine kinase
VAQRTAALQATLVELQRAMALRDEFMAMISHELRTPLAGVLTMAELLQEQVGGALAPRQLIYVANIQNSGERLLGVVNSILSYTRLLAGDVPLQPAPCELAALLDTAAHHARDKALAKNQIVSTGVTPPDLTLMSDAEALIQVLERLLDNAVKFTPAGGQLGVTAQLAAPNTVEIAVWDSGPGLGEADLNDLVKPLTQGDGRLARSHEGIGMGLAYVHQLLLLLGGTLGYGWLAD